MKNINTLLRILLMYAHKGFSQIAEANNFKVESVSRLTGGDINEVFLLTTTSGEQLVIKLNNREKFPGMFEAEKAGLEALAQPGVIDVPRVLHTGTAGEMAYLLLQYKAPAPKRPDFSEVLGQQLATLHRQSAKNFGFSQHNYIGSLPQYNHFHSTASDFYIEERLKPQLKMAEEKGFKLAVDEKFFSNISELIPPEPPSLIHGDLWGGNYLVNQEGLPCLIDPATAYAPREMDLAMMKLFGGFGEKVFHSYQENFPLAPGFEERVQLWQLYYLLVHLNIFGAGYKNQVESILKTYN